MAGLRRTVGVRCARYACKNRHGDLPVFLLLLQHLKRDHLHGVFRFTHALHRFDLRDAEVLRCSAEIVDADDEHRSAIRLNLS